MLDYVLKFIGELKTIQNKIVKFNLYLIAHNGSGFDSYVVLNNLTQWKTIVTLIKNGTGFVSLKNLTVIETLLKRFLNMFILDADYYILKIHQKYRKKL